MTRRIALDQSLWVGKLANECSAESCPEMRANEWLQVTPSSFPFPLLTEICCRYLCAAHVSPPPNGCSAIDYMTHTLDGSIALLNSTRYFSSRLSIPEGSLRFLPVLFRRMYRSLAHAYLWVGLARESFAEDISEQLADIATVSASTTATIAHYLTPSSLPLRSIYASSPSTTPST